jgi:predicted  nucleic acid-binding Zn-ribbon protein
MRDETKKIKSQFELKLTDMRAEKEALLSELATVRKDIREIAAREYSLTEQVTALESELAATQQQLANTRSRAERTQSELTSQRKDLQVEKGSLISDSEKARSKTNEMISRKEQVNGQTAKLESGLATARQELAEMQRQTEYAQTQLDKQLRGLQAENRSLVSDLEHARKETDDAGIRAESRDAQRTSLEFDVAAFDLAVRTICEEESGIDVAPSQTEPESPNENQAEIAIVAVEAKGESSVEVDIAKPVEQIKASIEEQPSAPLVAQGRRSMLADAGSPQTECQEKPATAPTVEEIKPSIEVAAAQEEPIEANVENVEGPDPTLDSEAEINAEDIEPEPIPEVEVTESLEVTAEEVQAADFKSGADKILFTKAVSDFASQEAASRADAVGVIAGIRHELSSRLLITHMADEPSALVRRECVKALATLEIKEGISAIERALADEAPSVRLAAVWGLYRLAGTESVQALIPMLSDRDASVRRRAITCIGWVGGQIAETGNHHCQQVISALIRCLNDSSESIKNTTLDALQAVTGKKMPASRTSPECLVERWRKWWKAELLG